MWAFMAEPGTLPYTILGQNTLTRNFSFIKNIITETTTEGISGNMVTGNVYEHRLTKKVLEFKMRDYLPKISQTLLLAKVSKDDAKENKVAFINNKAVKSNHTNKQTEQARIAWDVWESTSFMEPIKFKAFIKNDLKQKANGINTEDFDRAMKIWGTTPYYSGRARSRKKHDPVSDNSYNENLKETQKVSADLMFIDGIPLLISTSSPLGFGQVDALESKSTGPLREALKLHVMRLKSKRLVVMEVEFDGESGVKSDIATSNYIGTELKVRPVDSKASKSERRIQTQRDRMRSTISVLAFNLARSLYIWLAKYCMNISNWERTSSRENSVSPNEITLGRKPDVDRDFTYKFGEYVRTTAPKGTQHSSLQDRTESCIALTPDPNGNGWWFLKLDTMTPVHRSSGKSQPMNPAIIALLNQRELKERTARDKILATIKQKKAAKKNLSLAEKRTELNDGFSLHGKEIPPTTESQEEIDQETPSNALPGVSEVEGSSQDGASTLLMGENASGRSVVDIFPGGNKEQNNLEDLVIRPPIVGNKKHVHFEDVLLSANTNVILEQESDEDDGDVRLPLHLQDRIAARVMEDTRPLNITNILPMMSANLALITSEKNMRARMHREIESLAKKIAVIAEEIEAQEARVTREIEAHTAKLNRGKRKGRGQNNSRFAQACAMEIVSKATETTSKAKSQNMNVKQALEQLGDAGLKACQDELIQIIDMSVLEPIYAQHLSKNERWATLRTKLFVKVKNLASGALDKVKARLVAGGDDEDRTSYDPTSLWSPCVALPSTMLTLSIAALEKKHIKILDIKAAYLNEPLKKGSAIRVKLTKECTKILLYLYPEMEKYVDSEGIFYSWLNRSLYGIIQASSNLFAGIREVLTKLGFKQNAKDDCVFNKGTPGVDQITTCIYVDDILISADNEELIDEFITNFKKNYKDVTIKEGPIMDYLGMQLEHHRNGEIKISMKGYIDKIMTQWDAWNPKDLSEDLRKYATPMDTNLFNVDYNSPLLAEEKKEQFHSLVGTLIFMIKRARPDCLCPLAFLSGRVQAPTQQDWDKMRRLISFLKQTRERELIIRPTSMRLEAYMDASYGTHVDRKSHSGAVLTLAGAPYFCKSSRQKTVAKSSCEAEIIAMSDCCGWLIWSHQFLKEQGYNHLPKIKVWEDNESVIILIKKGKPASDASRHFEIRYFYVKDLIDREILELEHLGTEEMTADVFSKGTTNEIFVKLSHKLMNSASDLS